MTQKLGGFHDLFAGFIGALIVIPQGITFAYLAGLTPENGIYCAIFSTLIMSLVGSCPLIGGPNTAVALLLGAAVIPFAGRGSALFINYVLILSIMVGLIQVAIGLMKGARFFKVFNPAAIAAINMGVGTIIILSSLAALCGAQSLDTRFIIGKPLVLLRDLELVNPYSATIGLTTLATGLAVRRYQPRFSILIAFMLGTILSYFIYQWDPYLTQVDLLGYIPIQIWPLAVPSWSTEHVQVIEALVPDALIIAFIGLSQTLVIAQDLRFRYGYSVNLTREIFAQGIANAISPLFGSYAGSGSFNRTAMNLELGAKSRWAGVLSALFVGLIVTSAMPLLAMVSMPVIAALLALVGVSMIKKQVILQYSQPQQQRWAFWLTYSAVVILGLKSGILFGALLSILGFLRGAAHLEITKTNADQQNTLELKGNLYFGNIDQLIAKVNLDSDKPLVLDLSRVGMKDQTARINLHSWARSGTDIKGLD